LSTEPPAITAYNPPFSAGAAAYSADDGVIKQKVPTNRGVSRRELARQVRTARDLPIEKKRRQFAFISSHMPELIGFFDAFNRPNEKCALLELSRSTADGWVNAISNK